MKDKVQRVRLRVGQRVKQLRSFRGLSQEKLAEQVGNSSTHMGLVERGQVNVGIDTLILIAEKLSVDLSELTQPARASARGQRTHIITEEALDEIIRLALEAKRGPVRQLRRRGK